MGVMPFTCDKCDKKFAQRSHLVYHIKRHKGERFECDKCGKMYATEHYFKNHLKNKH